MIVLDTHMWFWWVQGDPALPIRLARMIEENEGQGLAVSAISLLEVSQATASGRMELPLPPDQWLRIALRYPGIRLIPLTPEIVTEAYRLPEPFHRDPADRLIVATSRVLGAPLATADGKILAYSGVECVRS